MVNILDLGSAAELCGELAPVLRIIGYVYVGIMIFVPIGLIFSGMFDMAKAVMEKKEDDIKKAQNLLIKRAIAAVIVFLVTAIVGVLMSVLGKSDYKECLSCITSPFGSDCKTLVNSAENNI